MRANMIWSIRNDAECIPRGRFYGGGAAATCDAKNGLRLIAAAPAGTAAHFFRTAAGEEINLLLDIPGHRQPWALEIKRGLAPKLERGFHSACEIAAPERRLLVFGGAEQFPLAEGVAAVQLVDFSMELGTPPMSQFAFLAREWPAETGLGR